MKKNVNVFIAVVLCAALCGGIVWLQTANDEKLGWNIHDNYGEAPAYSNGAAYTNATFAGPANDGGVMALSSRSLGHSGGFSHAGAYAVSYGVSSAPLTSNLLPLTSAPAGGGLYETSGGTFNSYGGGGNGGAAMSYSQSPIANRQSNSGAFNPSLQGGAGVGSISPIAYSTARRGEMSSAWGDNPAQMLAEDPAMAMANAANVGNGFYAGAGYTTVDYFGTASYGGRKGIQGRRNANSVGGNVDDWIQSLINGEGWMFEEGGINYFDQSVLMELYNNAIANGDLPPGMTWEQFLEWFAGQSDRYAFPIPDGVWFLCMLALGYTLYIIYRRKRQQIQMQ